MEREKWLNGWKRQGDIIFMGPGAHCVGCGRTLGITNVVIEDGNWNPPKKAPDWPFPENDCPICSKEYREITVDDVAKLPLSVIRQALAIKKSAQQDITAELLHLGPLMEDASSAAAKPPTSSANPQSADY